MLQKSNFIPTTEPQLINEKEWEAQTSYDYKWELISGVPFGKDGIERDRLAIALLTSMGYNHLFSILDSESLAILKHAVQNIQSTDKRFKEMSRYLEDRDKAISDHVSRMNSAKEKGEREEVIKVVKNLLQENYSVDDITKYTGLTAEEIKRLKEEN
jgi:predicted transposase/invertase (TIGR01784 family)